MFAALQFTPINVEAVLADYVVSGSLKSRGEILNFLNDRRYPTFSLYGSELQPTAASRKIETVKQELVTINKASVIVVSVEDREALADMQLTISERRVIFYCGSLVVHGLLHVPADAPDEDILDEAKDFFGITKGSIYSLVPLSIDPKKDVPLMLINRHKIEAYSVLK